MPTFQYKAVDIRTGEIVQNTVTGIANKKELYDKLKENNYIPIDIKPKFEFSLNQNNKVKNWNYYNNNIFNTSYKNIFKGNRIKKDKHAKIGIDIGGSHVGVGLIKNGVILNVEERVLNKQDKVNIKESLVNIIIDLVNRVVEESNVDLKDIEFIGIASPGTISNNIIMQATNLGLENFDLIAELQKYINLPMQLKNDSKCAALAEKCYGSMKDYDDCVFLCIGTGIGGAAFVKGEMLEPKRFSAFEFGHMIINKDGRQCSCGKKGCFETYASIRAFRNKVAEVLGIDNDFSGQYLREQLLVLDNEKVKEVVSQFIDDLSIGICNLIDIFEPEIVVLGGSFSYYEGNPIYDRLLEKIGEDGSRFNKNSMPKIELAELKNNARNDRCNNK